MTSSQKRPPGTKDDPSQSNNPVNSAKNKPGDKKSDVRTLESKANSSTASTPTPEVVGAATNHPNNSTTKATPPKTSGRRPSEQSRKLSIVSQQSVKAEQRRRSSVAPNTTLKSETKGTLQKHATVSQENKGPPTATSGGPVKVEQGRRITSAALNTTPKTETKDTLQKQGTVSQENKGPPTATSGGPVKVEQGRRITSAALNTTPKTENNDVPKKQTTVSQQNAGPTTVVQGGPVKLEQVSRMSASEPQVISKAINKDGADPSASTVTLPPSGQRLSQISPRTRFEFSHSSYDLTSTKTPTAPAAESATGSAITVTSNRPGILKRSSSTAPPVVGARPSLPAPVGPQLTDIPRSASSSVTSLKSASTRTLINKRSRERMLKRIERLGPRQMDPYSPSASLTVPPELSDQLMEAKSPRSTSSRSSKSSNRKSSGSKELEINISSGPESLTTTIPDSSRRRRFSLLGSEEPPRRASAESTRSRSNKSYVSNPSYGIRSSTSGTKDTGGLRLKELVSNDAIIKSVVKAESKSIASSTRGSKSEDTNPVAIPPSSHGAFRAKRSDSVMWCQNVSREALSDVGTPQNTPESTSSTNADVNNSSVRDNYYVGTKEIDKISSLQKFPTVRRGSLKGTSEQKGSIPDRRGVSESTKRKETNKGSRSNSLTAIRRSSNLSTTMMSLNETQGIPNNRKSLSQDTKNKSNETLDRRKQKARDGSQRSVSIASEGVHVDSGAPERRRSSLVSKSISEVLRQTAPKVGSYSSEHKTHKSIPTLPSSRRSSTAFLSRISETHRGADNSETPLLPNLNRKAYEMSSKSNTLRRTEVSRIHSDSRASSRRCSELSNVAANTMRRLSNPGERVDITRRPSEVRKSSSFLGNIRRDSDPGTRTNNKKNNKEEDKDRRK